jgi:hypothetical protein
MDKYKDIYNINIFKLKNLKIENSILNEIF